MIKRRIFKLPKFSKWMHQLGITDVSLKLAIEDMSKGLIDADLGGGLVKKRIAYAGKGKRGGARTIVATNHKDRWIFLYGFKKNDRDNITDTEKEALKEIASVYLNFSEIETNQAILNRQLVEVNTHEE